MTFMIISLLLPSLTAVAEAMSSDPLRVCALSPSPRGSVFFTCTNLSVCTKRRRFFAGHEPSIVDVKHTTQPRDGEQQEQVRPRNHLVCAEDVPRRMRRGQPQSKERWQTPSTSQTRQCHPYLQ